MSSKDSKTAIKTLEEIELNESIGGNEGLDPNYVSQIRTQYLFNQHDALVKQMQFADAKAAALITLTGIVALRGPALAKVDTISSLGIFGYLVIGSLALSMLFTLISVFPRYPSAKLRAKICKTDRWSWPALAANDYTADEYSSFMRKAEVTQLVQSVALSNSNISKILLSKYRFLKLGFVFGVLALALVFGVLVEIIRM